MLQSLSSQRHVSSNAKDEALGAAAAALAAATPRAILSAHFVAEINAADHLSAGRSFAPGWGGLDIVGDLLIDSQLMNISDEHLGFPDAKLSIQVEKPSF